MLIMHHYNENIWGNLEMDAPSLLLLAILLLWELVWKGIALWKAAREGQKYWFIAILILSTVGILPIIYIFFIKDGKKGL